MNASGAIDLEASGYNFTWRNKVHGYNIIKKRLDRAICSSDWLLLYPMLRYLTSLLLFLNLVLISFKFPKKMNSSPSLFGFLKYGIETLFVKELSHLPGIQMF